MEKNKVLLIYPKLGYGDKFILDLPLSLIYAAHDSLKSGYKVEILDLRLYSDWKKEIEDKLTDEYLLVGISVMTGHPVKYSVELSKYIKKNYKIPVVWGGIHPTLLPEQTLIEEYIDYLVIGPGSLPLKNLCDFLSGKISDLKNLKGIVYKEKKSIIVNDREYKHEIIPLKELAYDLVDYYDYSRFKTRERVFSIFTSYGCPHKCTYCYAPILYNKYKRKWIPIELDEVIEHIKFLIDKYGINYFSLIDEVFLTDKKRMREFCNRILTEKIQVKFGIRGARIDDLSRLEDSDFKLLEDIGVCHMQIGAESGSQRILDIMKKGITVEQTINVNLRLSKYKKLLPIYNIFSGIPGEKLEDLYCTVDLIWNLNKTNPYCYISTIGNFVPFPGSELYELSLKHGFIPPDSLEKWGTIDGTFSEQVLPWLDNKFIDTLRSFQIAALMIDKKINTQIKGNSLLYRFIRLCANIYRPFAIFRIKNKFFKFSIEYQLAKLFAKLIEKNN